MRIVLLGTGNLATRLGLALRAKEIEIIQVFGRSESVGIPLSKMLESSFTTSKNSIRTDADIYILAASEEAIPDILVNSPIGNQLIVHTSGSVPMEILSTFSNNYGVFYPLQTLSKQREVDFSTIPICIEANNTDNLKKLHELANLISEQVFLIDSTKRLHLHLAAVFVCNFVNHLYSIGTHLLQDQNIDFDLLKPLILETAQKVMTLPPEEVQTGPAIRGNQPIQDLHQKMLEQHPEWQKIYKMISKDIILLGKKGPS
jgi:predicted short-subunit dehydrogenase-like oxidoreductase (DUF2520 family)